MGFKKIEPGIVIPQAKKVGERMVDLTEKVKELSPEAKIINPPFWISLYPGFGFPPEKEEEVLETIKDIVQKTTSFVLEPKELAATEDGSLVIYFRRSRKIEELHARIATRLRLKREGYIDERFKKEELSHKEKRNVKNYGTTEVMDQYFPRSKIAENVGSSMDKLKLKVKKFNIRRLGMYDRGQERFLKKFEIPNSER